MQLPEGQRDASRAAHPPAQLTPLPHVVFSGELSNKWQQVTSLNSSEFVNTTSKNRDESEVVFDDSDAQEATADVHGAVSIGSPSQASALKALPQ